MKDCEHYWGLHSKPGLPDVRVCAECREPDWDHLAQQWAEPRVRKPSMAARIVGYAIGIPATCAVLVGAGLVVGIALGLLVHALKSVWQ